MRQALKENPLTQVNGHKSLPKTILIYKPEIATKPTTQKTLFKSLELNLQHQLTQCLAQLIQQIQKVDAKQLKEQNNEE